MSFMFNPHPYDDYTPVNRPAISDEIKGRTTFGAEKVMKALSGAISKQKAEKGNCIVAIEGYPSADFEQFAERRKGDASAHDRSLPAGRCVGGKALLQSPD